MIEFAIAFTFMIITPGPGVLTTAGVGAGFGWRAGALFLGGLCLGTNLVMLAVATGLAAILFTSPELRIVLTVASIAFFLWLAFKIAFSGAKVGFIQSETAPGFWGGVTLQLINPKAYVVSNLVISGYAFLPGDFVSEVALKFLITNLIWVPIHIVWLYAGVSLKRMNLSARAQRTVNVSMALALLIVVALAASAI